MKRTTTAVLAFILIAPLASAADLFGVAPPATVPASEAPTAIETGSNWYVRGDLGVSFDNQPTMTYSFISAAPPGTGAPFAAATTGANGSSTDFDGTLGLGYRFSDYLRFDATWDYRSGPSPNRYTTVVCPYELVGLSTQGQTPILLGYYYNPNDTCVGDAHAHQFTNDVLANGYLDLGSFSGFTPYLGGGVGLAATTTHGAVNYIETANGQIYAANLSPTGGFPPVWVDVYGNPLSPQPPIAFTQQNWNRTLNTTTASFAWALMAGFSYQLTPSVLIDVGYRYLNGGVTTTLVNSETGTSLKQHNVSQQVRIGVRYLIQ